MNKVMLVSLCIAILSFGIVNKGQSSVVTLQQKKIMPTPKAKMVMYTCTMHPIILSDKPGKCPVCKMDLVKKEMSAKAMAKLVYTCSMHPNVKSAKPGKCQICKMDMVKVNPITIITK